jgi:hypothetical protein
MSLYFSLSLLSIYHHQPTDPLTWIQKPSPNHVHQRSTRTYTIPITSSLYHIMHQPYTKTCTIPCTLTCTIPCINHVPYQVHQPCTKSRTSTMYHTKYVNHVPYHVHRSCIKPIQSHASTISLMPYTMYHKISSMKC